MAYPIRNGANRITCAYGTEGKVWISGWHQGVDFGAPVGEAVHAVANGVVVGVGIWGSAFGEDAVVIRHRFRVRSYYCVYAHMSKHTVKTGDRVKLGQKVGEVGTKGMKVTGPHLHFEAQKTARWQIGGGVDPKWMFMYKGNG